MILNIYRWMFLASFANVGIALWCIIAPFDWAAFIGVAPMTYTSASLFMIWGGTLLGLHLVYIPGVLDPLRFQCVNWASIAIKFWMSIIFINCGFDFYSFALWDFSWGAALLIMWLLVLNTRKEVKFMNA